MKTAGTSPEKWGRQPMGRENIRATEDGSIATGSRLVALWLRRVRGYQVSSVRRTPQTVLFGSIRYQNVWVLTADRGPVGLEPGGDAVSPTPEAGVVHYGGGGRAREEPLDQKRIADG